MEEYKPKLQRIYMEVAGLAVVLVILYFTEKASLTSLGIFGFGYLVFRVGIALAGIYGVRLEDDAIVIRFLIPFKKEKGIQYSDVESYIPISMPKARNPKPFMAMLNVRDQRQGILLTQEGIHSFDELNRILSDALPRSPTEPGEPSRSGRI